jgi:threonine dehydrogenase-like Zn-dependent dehydrogenase
MLVPEASCMPLPDDISCEQGSLMVDMLGTPLQAFKRSGMGPGDAIAIWGAGPIGLALLMVAVHRGARAAVVDLSEARLAMAEKLGASLGLKPGAGGAAAEIRRWSGGEGVRAAFDCVGSGHVCLEAISALAPKGTLAVVGVSRSLLLDPWEHLICRELALFGTRNFNAHDFPEMVQLVRNGLPLTHAVTHRFPLGRAGEAFGLFLSGQCGKILIVGD